jgi:hypothetical protein
MDTIIEATKVEPKLKTYFSLISGEIYTIREDEIKNLDEFQIPLKEQPKQSCRKCYGRLYWGRDIQNGTLALCNRCLRKYVDKSTSDTSTSDIQSSDTLTYQISS